MMMGLQKISLLATAYVLFALAPIVASADSNTKKNVAESSKAKAKKPQVRTVAQSQRLNVKNFTRHTEIKNSAEYALVGGDLEQCLEGKLVVREDDDGTIAILLGERVLAYSVAEGELVSDFSERDCKIIVRTQFSGKKVEFNEVYKCKKDSYEIHKVIEFGKNKQKSTLNYRLTSKKNNKSLPPLVCNLESI